MHRTRKLGILLTVIAALGFLAYNLFGGRASEIQAETNGLFLFLTNMGKAPLTVLDLQINGRPECGIEPQIGQLPPEPDAAKAARRDAERHEAWLRHQDLIQVSRDENQNVVLKTGDQAMWPSTCGGTIVSVIVKTNRGIAKFRFD